MVIDCIKDSVMTPYIQETTDTFTDRENTDNDINVLVDQLDETTLEETNMGGSSKVFG